MKRDNITLSIVVSAEIYISFTTNFLISLNILAIKNPPHLMILSDLLFEHFCAFQNKSFPEQGSAK